MSMGGRSLGNMWKTCGKVGIAFLKWCGIIRLGTVNSFKNYNFITLGN